MFKFKSLNVICYKFNSRPVPLCFANSVKKKQHVSNECKNTPISILSPIIGKKKPNYINMLWHSFHYIESNFHKSIYFFYN